VKFSAITVVILFSCPVAVIASPCAGIDRSLSETRKEQLAPVISTHLNSQLAPGIAGRINLKTSDVLQSFRYGKWHIVYVNTHLTDEPFLFYQSDPVQSRSYITIWAGAATRNEEDAIRQWVRTNAPSIPNKLSNCFAWHVTKDRVE